MKKRSLYAIANEYVDFHIEGKRVRIPYCIAVSPDSHEQDAVMGRTTPNKHYGAKGTPSQIKDALYRAAQQKGLQLQKTTPEEITQFMIDEGIGIDCSGFVYNVLDTYLKETRNISLDDIILRYPGLFAKVERLFLRRNRVRRSSAATLTNDVNTIKIALVKDIQPGDMLRLTHKNWQGKHIAIVVDKNKKCITYGNSSEYTKEKGPHFAKITIVDENKGLEYQKWEETTDEGVNYGKEVYDPKRGDSVRRLKLKIR